MFFLPVAFEEGLKCVDVFDVLLFSLLHCFFFLLSTTTQNKKVFLYIKMTPLKILLLLMHIYIMIWYILGLFFSWHYYNAPPAVTLFFSRTTSAWLPFYTLSYKLFTSFPLFIPLFPPQVNVNRTQLLLP